MSKVFVSSTCYDLIDLRAEVAATLSDLGLGSIMSDRPFSEFEVDPYKDSISTCLANVDASDIFLCILSQRYGPSLGKCGFPDVSATHLEYQRAKKSGKALYVFARDRLVGDHSFYGRNKASNPKLPWIKNPDDYKLFDLMDEHLGLTNAGPSNWEHQFTDSRDLCRQLRKIFQASSERAILERLSSSNISPWFGLDKIGSSTSSSTSTLICNVTNIGSGPAVDVQMSLSGATGRQAVGSLGPGAHYQFSQRIPRPQAAGHKVLSVAFTTTGGHRVQDDWKIEFDANGTYACHRFSRRKLLERMAFQLGSGTP